MRFFLPFLFLLANGLNNPVQGFVVTPTVTHSRQAVFSMSVTDAGTSVQEDCGCAATEFSGEPSSRAQILNARQAIRGLSVYNAAGDSVAFDSLLPSARQPVIAVFLRSLG